MALGNVMEFVRLISPGAIVGGSILYAAERYPEKYCDNLKKDDSGAKWTLNLRDRSILVEAISASELGVPPDPLPLACVLQSRWTQCRLDCNTLHRVLVLAVSCKPSCICRACSQREALGGEDSAACAGTSLVPTLLKCDDRRRESPPPPPAKRMFLSCPEGSDFVCARVRTAMPADAAALWASFREADEPAMKAQS